MDAKLILIIAGVGVAGFVLGLLVRGRRDDGRMMVQRSPYAPAAPTTPPLARTRICIPAQMPSTGPGYRRSAS